MSRKIREPRFWVIQALVVLATAPHYVIECSAHIETFESWQLNSVTISLYIFPLLYAALNYGWEGVLLTGLSAAALTSPSIWFWDRTPSHYLTEIGQLVVVLPVALLIAWRVDIETNHRRRAETTSASLGLLNQVGQALSHTLKAEAQVPIVLRKLISNLPFESAWLYLVADRQDAPRLFVERTDAGGRVQGRLLNELHRLVEASGATQVMEDTIAAPLSTEDGPLGSLGATACAGSSPTDEQVEVLVTVARQLCATIVNAGLRRERQARLQSYARHVTEAQEEERLRISRELHDETAQELVSLVRGLEQIRDRPEATARSLDELIEGTREAIRSVRRFSWDLRPSVLDDVGLTAAIEMMVEAADPKLAGGATLRMSGRAEPGVEAVELALFRIAQESLRNMEKHAQATSASVELEFKHDTITLSIADDGVGFAPSNVSDLARAGKLGLVGMKERCELVGGSLELQSSPGEGTRVAVTVRTRGSARDADLCPADHEYDG